MLGAGGVTGATTLGGGVGSHVERRLCGVRDWEERHVVSHLRQHSSRASRATGMPAN